METEMRNTQLERSLNDIRETLKTLTRQLNGVIATNCPELEVMRITNELTDWRRESLERWVGTIERGEIGKPVFALFAQRLFRAYGYSLTRAELEPIAERAGVNGECLYGHYLSLCHRRCTGQSVPIDRIVEENTSEAILLRTPIKDLAISVRLYNRLRAADIKTLGEMVSHSRVWLMRQRNFGRKALNEADILVEKLGLKFRSDDGNG